jgi:hypothetical protein
VRHTRSLSSPPYSFHMISIPSYSSSFSVIVVLPLWHKDQAQCAAHTQFTIPHILHILRIPPYSSSGHRCFTCGTAGGGSPKSPRHHLQKSNRAWDPPTHPPPPRNLARWALSSANIIIVMPYVFRKLYSEHKASPASDSSRKQCYCCCCR